MRSGGRIPDRRIQGSREARMTTRRTFLQYGAAGIGASFAGLDRIAAAATTGPLVERVARACRRLAPLGWRRLLLDATGGALDITAANLNDEFGKSLAQIDRSHPGFGDFSLD